MKNILIAIVTSLLLFGASAGASIYLNRSAETDDTKVEEATPVLDETDKESFVTEMANQMPVAMRPDQALTIEAVLQMSESARLRQAKLDEFEAQLKKEDQRMKLLFQDLKREKKELTAFSEGVEAKVAALDEMTVRLADVLKNIEKQHADLAKLEKKTGLETDKSSEIQTRVNHVKGWFESLEAKQAADILIDKANGGNIEFAAALLDSLPDRQKAKILPAINDPVLVNQLIDSLKIKPKKVN